MDLVDQRARLIVGQAARRMESHVTDIGLDRRDARAWLLEHVGDDELRAIVERHTDDTGAFHIQRAQHELLGLAEQRGG